MKRWLKIGVMLPTLWLFSRVTASQKPPDGFDIADIKRNIEYLLRDKPIITGSQPQLKLLKGKKILPGPQQLKGQLKRILESENLNKKTQ